MLEEQDFNEFKSSMLDLNKHLDEKFVGKIVHCIELLNNRAPESLSKADVIDLLDDIFEGLQSTMVLWVKDKPHENNRLFQARIFLNIFDQISELIATKYIDDSIEQLYLRQKNKTLVLD